MSYHIRLTPIDNHGAENPGRRAFLWIENDNWNGGGGGTVTLTPAYRVGRIGYGTVSFVPGHIQLYEHGDRARPILDLLQNTPTLTLHNGGTGIYMGPSGGRLPDGNLVWEVISIS